VEAAFHNAMAERRELRTFRLKIARSAGTIGSGICGRIRYDCHRNIEIADGFVQQERQPDRGEPRRAPRVEGVVGRQFDVDHALFVES
jgi:hypothetical protein